MGQDEVLFGRIALHYKLVSQDQLAEATSAWSQEGGLRGLGEILVERGVLNLRQLEQLRAVQRDYLAKELRPSRRGSSRASRAAAAPARRRLRRPPRAGSAACRSRAGSGTRQAGWRRRPSRAPRRPAHRRRAASGRATSTCTAARRSSCGATAQIIDLDAEPLDAGGRPTP